MECSSYIKVTHVFKIRVIKVILLIEVEYLIYDLHNDFFNKMKSLHHRILYDLHILYEKK